MREKAHSRVRIGKGQGLTQIDGVREKRDRCPDDAEGKPIGPRVDAVFVGSAKRIRIRQLSTTSFAFDFSFVVFDGHSDGHGGPRRWLVFTGPFRDVPRHPRRTLSTIYLYQCKLRQSEREIRELSVLYIWMPQLPGPRLNYNFNFQSDSANAIWGLEQLRQYIACKRYIALYRAHA